MTLFVLYGHVSSGCRSIQSKNSCWKILTFIDFCSLGMEILRSIDASRKQKILIWTFIGVTFCKSGFLAHIYLAKTQFTLDIFMELCHYCSLVCLGCMFKESSYSLQMLSSDYTGAQADLGLCSLHKDSVSYPFLALQIKTAKIFAWVKIYDFMQFTICSTLENIPTNYKEIQKLQDKESVVGSEFRYFFFNR